MPVPLTVSCFGKIQISFTFLVPAHPGCPGQRAVKRCVCVCVCVCDLSSLTSSEVVRARFLTSPVACVWHFGCVVDGGCVCVASLHSRTTTLRSEIWATSGYRISFRLFESLNVVEAFASLRRRHSCPTRLN